MDELRKSIEASEKSRVELQKLRLEGSREGMIKYNEVLLEAIERQSNVYSRLRLMGDPESTQTADEMEYVAEKYMGKAEQDSFMHFIEEMKKEIIWQLNMLTAGEYGNPEDHE